MKLQHNKKVSELQPFSRWLTTHFKAVCSYCGCSGAASSDWFSTEPQRSQQGNILSPLFKVGPQVAVVASLYFVTSLGVRSHGQVIQHCTSRGEKSYRYLKNIVEVIIGLNMGLYFCDTEWRKWFIEINSFSPEYFTWVCDVCLFPQALSQRDAPHRNFFFFDGLKGSGVVDYFGPKWRQSSSSVVFFLPSPLVFVTIHNICSEFWILSKVLWNFFVCFLIKQHPSKVWVFIYQCCHNVSKFSDWIKILMLCFPFKNHFAFQYNLDDIVTLPLKSRTQKKNYTSIWCRRRTVRGI